MMTLKSAPGSRLPVPKSQAAAPGAGTRGASAPSKLELLRQQYQQQMRRAKEEKLREMYYHNPPPSNKALLRIGDDDKAGYDVVAVDCGRDHTDGGGNGGGNVRDFFQQQRQELGGGKKGATQKGYGKNGYGQNVQNGSRYGENGQIGYGQNGSGPKGYGQGQGGYADSQRLRSQNRPPPHIPPNAYKGVGRDKSKPLAPISRDSSSVSSTHNGNNNGGGGAGGGGGHVSDGSSGGKIQRAFTLDENGRAVPFNKNAVQARSKRGNNNNNGSSKNATTHPEPPVSTERDNHDGGYRKPTPSSGGKKTRNFKEWQEEQKRKKDNLERQGSPAERGDQEPSSDYQKWQNTMDQEREDRLAQHSEKQGKPRDTRKASILQQQNAKHIEIAVESDDNEEDERIAEARRQEQELQKQLAKQQKELERIRQQRIKEEQEGREREKAEEKRRATQAARQQKLRQQEEAEQEEKMRRLEEINNNNQKLIAQHSSHHSRQNKPKAKERPSSNRTYSVTSTPVGEEEAERYPRDDSPPSKYLPMKPVRPRSRKTSITSVPSARGGDMEQRNNYNSDTKPKRQSYQPPKPKSTPLYPEEEEEDRSKASADPASFYIAAAEEAPTEDLHLVPCSSCGRKFAAERLAKHSKACVAKKKTRKPLDPSKMRTAGTDMAKYQHKSGREEPKKPKVDWRRKREDFINTIRYARAAQKAEESGTALPPPPPSDTSHLKPCPHCGRKFNEAAADRHIPGCQKRKEANAMRGPPKARRR